MADYIKRQAAIKTAEVMRKRCDTECIEDFYALIVESLSVLPSADVVEVVRCKDCKHRDPEDKKCDSGHDIIWQLPRRDDWYCADGERKDG